MRDLRRSASAAPEPPAKPAEAATGSGSRAWRSVLAAGCTPTHGNGEPGADASRPVVDVTELDASVTQTRFAEGTQDLHAGVTNNTERTLNISSATIRWRGLDFPTITIDDPVIPPGQTAAFTIRYGAPRCETQELGRPTMVTVVDGTTVVLPLRVEGPGLLHRLRDQACGQQMLAELVSVSLRLARRTESVGGTEVLPGRVVVRRHAGRTGTVTVEELGGSVLFSVEPREGPAPCPPAWAPDSDFFPCPCSSLHRTVRRTLPEPELADLPVQRLRAQRLGRHPAPGPGPRRGRAGATAGDVGPGLSVAEHGGHLAVRSDGLRGRVHPAAAVQVSTAVASSCSHPTSSSAPSPRNGRRTGGDPLPAPGIGLDEQGFDAALRGSLAYCLRGAGDPAGAVQLAEQRNGLRNVFTEPLLDERPATPAGAAPPPTAGRDRG